nr:class I SAM-dependent methyltransferase [Prochlorococcus marinus]
MLTNVRKYICDKITQSKEKISYSQLQFIIALGEQCFLNEYVYSFTEEEESSLNIIINRCIDGQLNEINISILSCYYPLYELLNQIPSLKSFNSYNQSYKELMILQISEPLQEIDLSKNIKKLGSINDDISQKVKSQYEENPYPRWRYGSHRESQKLSINQAINNDINPNSINHNADNRQLKVLVAGCGTGQHILSTQRYKNAQITSIDLSLSSLSYAQRKINELGIDNVELIQMDILEVGLLKMKFDIIESSGVLHHMNDPSQGLNALVDVLKNNGFLKLGLYSELARQDIIKGRNYIAGKDLQANEDSIRNFRETIFSGKAPELNSLSKRSDFYTLSSCRDLCFHAQEHRFTINQLQETLKSNELEFLGFLLPKPVKSLYRKYFPEDKTQTNLQNWERFEEQHPHTFRGMYQFWVYKKEN